MKNISYLAFAFAISVSSSAFSQVIPVEPLTKGFFGTQQTMTMLHKRNESDIVLVAVMGHPGHFGLRVGDSFVKNTTARMLRDLIQREKIRISVVILDSPFPLQGVGARSSSDHLSRIESVVRHYTEMLKLPVWLFGHSDGSISVSEYLNRSPENRKSINGVILSAGRDETRIREDWKLPALVLHHEKDGCDVTTFNGAKRYFARIKEANTGPTELAIVSGGFSSGAPCSTGYHMYEGAFDETNHNIADFIYRYSDQCVSANSKTSKCMPEKFKQIKFESSPNADEKAGDETDETLIQFN